MSILSTGMQGAQLGGKFGGGWGAAIGGTLGFLAGGKAQKRQEEATKKYNDQVVKFAAQDLFDLKRQQNIQNIRTSQALVSYQDNKKVQTSSVTAAMGAADIIGSSAEALKQTLDFQTQQAQAEVMASWETGVENYNTAVDQTTNQRESSLQRQSGAQQEDLGALVSGAVGVYNSAKGGGILNAEDYSKVRAGADTLMGKMSSIWSNTGSSSSNKAISTINSDVGLNLNMQSVLPRSTVRSTTSVPVPYRRGLASYPIRK